MPHDSGINALVPSGKMTAKTEMVVLPLNVKVRKNEVDTDGLVRLLRQHRHISNKDIATLLDVPLTEVEHWFRTDQWQCIPDPELWVSIKQLLGITTDEYDKQVTEFEWRRGVFEKAERCYKPNGVAPTVMASEGGGIKITENYD